jgi:PST family polysaccharide transporter
MNITVRSATFWSFVNSFGTRGLSFIFFVILSRQIGPAPLGVMAIAMAIGAVLDALIDLGLTDQFVRHQDAEDETFFSSVFWMQVGVAIGLVLLALLLAPIFASAFREPGLTVAICAVALASLSTAVSLAPLAWLRRKLDYRKIAMRNMIATIAGGIAGLFFAREGFALGSLIALHVANVVSGTLVILAVAEWRPAFVFSLSNLMRVRRIAAGTMGTKVLESVMGRVDQLAVGGYFGTTILGLYSLAVRLYDVFFQLLSMPFASVMLPHLAKYSSYIDEFRPRFLSALQFASLLGPPVLLLVVLEVPYLLDALFGEKWTNAGPYIQIILGMGAVHTVTFMHTVGFAALGKTSINLGIAVFSTVLWALCLFFLPAFGAIFAAILWALRSAVGVPVQIHLLKKLLRLQGGDYLGALSPMLIGLGLMAFTRTVALSGMETIHLGQLAAHLISALISIVIFASVAITMSPQLREVAKSSFQHSVGLRHKK